MLLLFFILGTVVCFTALIYFLIFASKKGDAVLLVGLPNTGKTAYWLQVMCGTSAPTHTSMKENVGEIPTARASTHSLKSKKITLVDIPGHSRLRSLFDQYLPQARAIAFFIDSVDINETLSPCAELLYSILTNAQLVNKRTPLMIVCNKRDIDFSYKLVTIKNKLETELNAMRKTKQNEMGTLGESGAPDSKFIPLGVSGQPFAFDTQALLPMYWCETSVKEGQVAPLTDWIWSI